MLKIHDSYFDSYVITPPNTLSKFIIKRNGNYLFSENKMQSLTNKKDSFCEAYCLYLNYLTKVIGMGVKSAVLNINYQRFSLLE